MDINPEHNKAKHYKRGDAPEPWSEEWMHVWPKGVPQGVVAAFESCGFEWGGRWATFCDGMHFSFKNSGLDVQV